MKRLLLLGAWLGGTFLFTAPCPAQQDAAALARRQEAYEDRIRMEARITALEEALQAFQRDISNLRSQIDGLRADIARARNEGASTPESLRELAAKIEEVDRKRQSDNEKVLAEFRRLAKSATQRSTPPAVSRTDDVSEYSIRAGDTLYDIVKALREEGLSITQEEVMKANPNVQWNKLQIGQKIRIPVAPPAR